MAIEDKDGHELALEPRGDGYVLSRSDSKGVTAELELSEVDVMHLARLAANFARGIIASKAPAGCSLCSGMKRAWTFMRRWCFSAFTISPV
jgi:hypothetical protein